jgi:branched-chain amino acid transport system ATP-binding protein
VTALTVQDLDAGYRDFQALFGVSLDLAGGETVALIGANGAGKSTLLMTIAGALRPWRGRITLDGTDIAGLADHQRARRGIAIVPEGRRLFPSLTAEENILVPDTRRGAGPWSLDTLYELFPMVAARRSHRAALLSGGEQQAVAIARALAANPRVLLMDEVSLGLARPWWTASISCCRASRSPAWPSSWSSRTSTGRWRPATGRSACWRGGW